MKFVTLLFPIFLFSIHALAQNVGIGTNTPQSKLHIKGGLLLDSTAGSTPVSGPGTRMMWIPSKNAFRAGHVTGTNWDNANIGQSSFAAGENVLASSDYSIALGDGSAAIELGAMAVGHATTASGVASTSTGNRTTASGFVSFSAGNWTKSKSYAGFVAGTYNDSADAADPISMNPLNRLFQIGAGTSEATRKNALTVLQNGNIGIGTVSPVAGLDVENSAVIFKNTVGSTPVSGAGTRFMWVPEKNALRAGHVSGSNWDDINIGLSSFAAGENVLATGEASVAMGDGAAATEWGAVAIGHAAIASNIGSTAIGSRSNTSAQNANSMGYWVKSKSFAGMVTGLYNDSSNAPNPYVIDPLNRIFQVGNGTSDNARSNAFTILQNGNIGIGELNPAVPLNFKSIAGNKISLYGTGTNHYGIGTQGSLLQLYTDISSSDIAFGYGNSNSFNENFRVKGNGDGILKGNFTVQNGKGIIRSADGTQKKQITTSVIVNLSLPAGTTSSVTFTFPESFSTAPDVYVGNVISGTGGWAEVVMSLSNISTTGGTLYVHNPRGVLWTPNFTVKIIAIGAQ